MNVAIAIYGIWRWSSLNRFYFIHLSQWLLIEAVPNFKQVIIIIINYYY